MIEWIRILERPHALWQSASCHWEIYRIREGYRLTAWPQLYGFWWERELIDVLPTLDAAKQLAEIIEREQPEAWG